MTKKNALEEGRRLLEAGQPEEALALLADLVDEQDAAIGVPALDMAARAAHALGRLEEAGTFFRRLRDRLKALFGERHPHVAAAQENMARLAQEQGRPDEALTLGREALSMLLEARGSDHEDVARARLNLSTHWYALKHYDEAEQEVREAMRIWEARDGRRSRHVATCLNNLGRLNEERGELRKGVQLHAEAASIRREVLGDDPETAFSLGNLGVAQLVVGDFQDAFLSLGQALTCYERLGLQDSPDALAYRTNLDICLEKMAQHQA